MSLLEKMNMLIIKIKIRGILNQTANDMKYLDIPKNQKIQMLKDSANEIIPKVVEEMIFIKSELIKSEVKILIYEEIERATKKLL